MHDCRAILKKVWVRTYAELVRVGDHTRAFAIRIPQTVLAVRKMPTPTLVATQ